MSGHDSIVNNDNRRFMYETGHVMQYICVHERNLRVLQRFSSISRAFPLVFVLVGEYSSFLCASENTTRTADDITGVGRSVMTSEGANISMGRLRAVNQTNHPNEELINPTLRGCTRPRPHHLCTSPLWLQHQSSSGRSGHQKCARAVLHPVLHVDVT